MHRVKRAFVLLGAASLLGTAMSAENLATFSSPRNPPAGYSRIYIFRPDFSSMGQYDSPVLWLNNKEVAKLDYKSYIDVLVRAGPIDFSLKPSMFASASWGINGTVDARDGHKSYLAIWTAGEGGSNNGMGFIPVFGGPLPLMPVPTQTAVKMRVLYEVVDEASALEAIQGLTQGGKDVILDELASKKDAR
jgi:hypothetical protein